MARSLDQILAELDPGFAGSRNITQQQIAALPGQYDAGVASLNAQKDQSFQDITDSARRHGLGFSGIPLGEQARYSATQFAPAVAKLQGDQNNARLSLEDTLNGLAREQRTQAEGIMQGEISRDEQIRQFNQNLAAQRAQATASNAGLAALLGGGGGQPAAPAAAAGTPAAVGSYGLKGKDGSSGYWFTDHVGNPVSAAQWAQLNNMPFIDLLSKMASSGDVYARQAFNTLGNNPNAINPAFQQQFAGLFSTNFGAPPPVNNQGLGRLNAQGQRISIRANGSR